MEISLQSVEKAVCVALSLTDNNNDLVQAAESLCMKTGMRLRLVNVYEQWADGVALGMIPIPDIDIVLQLEATAKAETKLREIASKVDRRLKVETQVLTGPIADAIISDAQVNNAALIICGRRNPENSFLPSGFSTAMALLSHARIPVLVLHRDHTPNFVAKNITFIVADDLRNNTLTALQKSLDLAILLDATVCHVHCASLSKSQIANMVSANMNPTIAKVLDQDELYASIVSNLGKKLRQRAEQININLNDETYITKVIEGETIEGITAYAKTLKDSQNILVFGRHQKLHFKPFGIGQVPFKLMMSSKHPVLVIPS